MFNSTLDKTEDRIRKKIRKIRKNIQCEAWNNMNGE